MENMLMVGNNHQNNLNLNYVRNNIEKAITIQQAATYGDFLSPILAHFQNVPNNPVLFLSMRLGKKDRK